MHAGGHEGEVPGDAEQEAPVGPVGEQLEALGAGEQADQLDVLGLAEAAHGVAEELALRAAGEGGRPGQFGRLGGVGGTGHERGHGQHPLQPLLLLGARRLAVQLDDDAVVADDREDGRLAAALEGQLGEGDRLAVQEHGEAAHGRALSTARSRVLSSALRAVSRSERSRVPRPSWALAVTGPGASSERNTASAKDVVRGQRAASGPVERGLRQSVGGQQHPVDPVVGHAVGVHPAGRVRRGQEDRLVAVLAGRRRLRQQMELPLAVLRTGPQDDEAVTHGQMAEPAPREHDHGERRREVRRVGTRAVQEHLADVVEGVLQQLVHGLRRDGGPPRWRPGARSARWPAPPRAASPPRSAAGCPRRPRPRGPPRTPTRCRHRRPGRAAPAGGAGSPRRSFRGSATASPARRLRSSVRNPIRSSVTIPRPGAAS